MDEPVEIVEQQPESKPTPPKAKAASIPKRSMPSSTTKPKPSTTSALKTSSMAPARTTTGTTLSKPPARPTVGSTLRKPTASSTNAVNAHQPRPSISSADENTKSVTSGDEKKPKPALGAPKRLSMAGSTTSSRLASERKSVTQPTTISERKPVGRASTASPIKTARPPSAGSRPTTKSSISSSRAAEVGDVKKRLSTIPASPTSKQGIKIEDQKENNLHRIPETSKGKGLARPPLGTRQSTRSTAIQQRVREYELVNEMLQAAMAAEDDGDETQKEHLTTKVDDAITSLKANLEVTEEASTAEKSTMLQESTKTVSILESQLQESRAIVDALSQELEELRTQMAESTRSVHEKAGDVENAAESISAARSAEIEELKKQHGLEISSLHQKLQEVELSQQERAEQSLKELEDAKRTATEVGDTKTTQLLEDQKSRHSKAIEALENDLALERKAIKESADKVSLLERVIEEHKGNLASVTSKVGEYEKTIEARQDQLASRDRELQGQGGVIKSLQDEIAALQQAKNAEAEALKQTSAQQIGELQKYLASLKSAADRSSEESAVSEAHTQEDMMRKEQEITKLGQVIERLQDEIQSVHEAKSIELDERLLQIRQEHDKTIMALKAEHQISIDGLGKSHNGVVDKLAVEARNNRTAHERQILVLNDERSKVQKSLEHATNLLKASQEETEKRMEELESKHNEALRTANENLQNAEKTLADSQQLLKQTREDSEQTTATTIKTLEEKIQALEGQSTKDAAALKSSRGDMRAAQEQVASLKQVLETIEKDSQSKEEHHTGSLKKAIAEAEAVTKALSEKSTGLKLAEKNHAKAIESIKSEHEADLERARSDLTRKHDSALKELQTKHDDLLAARSTLEKIQQDEAEQLKAEHERDLADSSKVIADLQHAHLRQLEEVIDAHLGASKQLEEEFSNKVADAERTHNTALDGLQKTHEKTLLDLRAELEDSHLRSTDATKTSHDSIVHDLQTRLEQHKADLVRAQLEVQNAFEQAENRELAKVRSDLQASNEALTAAQSEASRLVDEVNDMKRRLDQDQKTIDKLESAAREASKARADSSSREVHSLREQLDGALQEAETQRASSDIARKEFQESAERLKQFKARGEELEAKLQAVNEKLDLEPKIRTPGGSTRKANRNKGSKNHPRLGQKSWTGEQGDGEVAGSPSQRKEGENLGSSIQGTMASIKEQLRQLDEVNEDMLEGHARMANMLSNVPESPIPSPSRPSTAV